MRHHGMHFAAQPVAQRIGQALHRADEMRQRAVIACHGTLQGFSQ